MLDELDRIEAAVRRLPTGTLRSFYRVCMSNILRGVSWQKDDDLRIRREKTKIGAGETIDRFLKEAMFLVVGNNRTTAGGQSIEIRTAEHLGEIANDLGFRLTDDMAMDMLVSRDIFRKNAVPSERIMRLDKLQ